MGLIKIGIPYPDAIKIPSLEARYLITAHNELSSSKRSSTGKKGDEMVDALTDADIDTSKWEM